METGIAEKDVAGRSVRVEVSPGVIDGELAVRFEADAVPGTLAAFAGVLALAQLSIVSAMVTRIGDRVADVFEVASDAEKPEDAADLAVALAEAAASALSGESDVHGHLHRSRSAAAPHPASPPVIEMLVDSEVTTGIIVRAADRPGLLHDIAYALSAQGMRVRSLSALTFSGRAHDTLRIVDTSGEAPRDEDVLAALERSLRTALSD